MPIYEYRCSDCRETFEVLSSYRDRTARRPCPHCSGESVQPLFSRVAMLSGESDGISEGAGCGCGGHCACTTH